MTIHLKDLIESAGPLPSTKPEPDFWAIVALGYRGASGDVEGFVIQQSPDCFTHDIFINGVELSENGDDFEWMPYGARLGVYRITMNPIGDEDNFKLNVTKAEKLWELPA